MRKFVCLAVAAACLLLLPAANAAGAAGVWKGAFDFEGSNVPLTFHLTVANGEVQGTVEGLPTTPAAIHDGKADGSSLSFWVDTDYEGQTYKLVFKGAVSQADDQIAFTFGTDDGSWESQVTAIRAPDTALAPAGPDISGTWKGSFDFQGSAVPLTFHLSSSAGAVSGTVEGLPTSPAAIHEGKLDGDTVTFWVDTDYEGQTYKLVYKGKVAATRIDFNFGADDGSWSSELTATKTS